MKLKGIKLKAVLFGALTDVGGSLALGSIFGVVFGIALAAQGVPPSEIELRQQSLAFLIPSLVIGFGATVVGGYVAGHVARKSEILHGGIVGAVGIPFGILFATSLPLWYNVISIVGVVPLG